MSYNENDFRGIDNVNEESNRNSGLPDSSDSPVTEEKVGNDIEKQETPDLENEIPQGEMGDDLPVLPEKSATQNLKSIVLCFFIAFGGFIFGYDTGTISGFTNMPVYQDMFKLLKDNGKDSKTYKVGLIVSIFNVGCAFGCLFFSKIADVRGRRIGMMAAVLIYVVGIIIQIASQNSAKSWIEIVIGRLISGFGVGTISVLSPLFIGEISPKAFRGTLVCCFQLNVTFGIFMGYCINYATYHEYTDTRQWRITLGLSFGWAILLFVGMIFLPESPRYLIEKNKLDEAKKSIAISNSVSIEDPGVYTEMQMIQAGIEREKIAGSASWSQLIYGKPKIFLRVMTGVLLQSLQQLTGNNYFFYYGTTIFTSVGLDDSFETSIVLGVVNFASTFLGIYLIDKLGRRLCLLSGSVSMMVALLVYSVLGTVGDVTNPEKKARGDAMIFITTLFIFCFASTWAGGVYSIISEIYPLRIRSKGMSVATAANWTWGFLISFFTTPITGAIHFSFGFVFFGCVVFGTIFTFLFVYETKGLSLEEVDQLYSSGVPAWRSSGWTPPSKHDMAFTTGYAADAKPEEERKEELPEEERLE